jgi:hypothetical protein
MNSVPVTILVLVAQITRIRKKYGESLRRETSLVEKTKANEVVLTNT